MFVTVSTGTGGGLILNGQLMQGKNGKAGHIGLALLDESTCIEDVSCGRYTERTPDKLAASAAVIARMIANKTIELDLEAVSIGGGVALGVPDYLDLVRKNIASFKPEYHAEIYQAALGDDAGLIGAATYAHNNIFKAGS